LAFMKSWMAATYNRDLGSISVELQFTGTAIYVFFILANDQGEGITTTTNCDFILDGRADGKFRHTPTTSPDLEYNALAYSNTALSNTAHNLTFETTGIERDIYLNFDYAVYTFDDRDGVGSTTSPSTPSTSSPSQPTSGSATSPRPVGAIVGGAVGAAVGLLALGLCIFLFWRYRRRRAISLGLDPLIPEASSDTVAYAGYTSSGSQIPFADHHHATGSHGHPSSGDLHSGYTESLGTGNQHISYAEPNAQRSLETNSEIVGGAAGGYSQSPSGVPHSSWVPTNHGSRDVLSALPTGEVMLTATTNTGEGQLLPTDPPISSVSPTTSQGRGSDRNIGSPPLTTSNSTREQLQQIRQDQLNAQMLAIQREMRELNNETGRRATMTRPPKGGMNAGERELVQMREQIRTMREQIEFLQSNQDSAWAQGLSDDPPPGYTPLANPNPSPS